MENVIQKHIDSLKKKRIKSSLLLYDEEDKKKRDNLKIKIGNKYEYGKWLLHISSVKLDNEYFPILEEEIDLYALLTLKIFYGQRLKQLCDVKHPLIYEFLRKIKIDDSDIEKIISNIGQIKIETLDYYLLFEEELELEKIESRIDILAQDSSQGTIISHSAKMTHPSCRYPKIIYEGKFRNDGFLRTGNNKVDFDMQINAVKLKVFKFFSLKYKGVSLKEYIANDNYNIFVELFNVSEEKSKFWIKKFSSCLRSQDYRTDRFIKQVYFPADSSYHVLSLLHPSGLTFKFKDKIDYLNKYSSDRYIANKKKKEDKYSNIEFATVPNLTEIKYGGEHPKNISGLNNKYQSHYLLNSMPPVLESRDIHFPKVDFFKNSISIWEFKSIFFSLHYLYKRDYPKNMEIRDERDGYYGEIIDSIIERMYAVREVSTKQYYEKNSKLKHHQKVWLIEAYKEERENDDDWLEKLIKEIARWIVSVGYKKVVGKKEYIKFGNGEYLYLLQLLEEQKESFRW